MAAGVADHVWTLTEIARTAGLGKSTTAMQADPEDRLPSVPALLNGPGTPLC